MADKKDIRWIKIIAIFHLVGAIICLVLLLVSFFFRFEEPFTKREIIELTISLFVCLIIYFGLWRFTSWGWKVTVFTIPLWSAYDVIDISILNKTRGDGMIYAPFLLINAFILMFILKPKIRKVFSIAPDSWKAEWTVDVIFSMAAFVFAYDLVNDIVAFVLALSLLFGFRLANKYRIELKERIPEDSS